jgi:hypothetical protein
MPAKSPVISRGVFPCKYASKRRCGADAPNIEHLQVRCYLPTRCVKGSVVPTRFPSIVREPTTAKTAEAPAVDGSALAKLARDLLGAQEMPEQASASAVTAKRKAQPRPAGDLKTTEVDYFAMLSRAVARLDRDSYEARGAVYDRAQEALAKRLASATPPFSKEEAAKQRLALGDAIRRIGFEDREDHYLLSIEQTPEQKTTAGTDLDDSRVDENRVDDSRVKPERKSLFGRVAAYLIFAALILGIGIGAYAYSTGSIDRAFLTSLLERTALSGGALLDMLSKALSWVISKIPSI